MAAARGHAARAVESAIGSKHLNEFLVFGHRRRHPVQVITLLGAVVLRGSRKITRLEGAMLVAAYIAFHICPALL